MLESQAQEHVRIESHDPVVQVILNRESALNALTTEMVKTVRLGVAAANERGTAVLLRGEGSRGFCAGGDVKSMTGGGHAAALDFLQTEYQTDLAIANSSVPVVAIMDGYTMGGGIGLTGHAAHRVVTERSVLAMPETRIGITPDVGSNHLLAAAPGWLGDLLAAGSLIFNGADAIAIGFADHYVPSERLDTLRENLLRGERPEVAIAAAAEEPPASTLLADYGWFADIAVPILGDPISVVADAVSATEALLQRLETAAGADGQALAATLRAMCPTAVVVALAQVARVRAEQLTLEEVFADDYRVAGRMMARGDFAEGVRAQLIDKDRQPRWSTNRVEAVDRSEVAAILDPQLAEGETALQL